MSSDFITIIDTASSNSVIAYNTPQTLTQNSDGTISMDGSLGINAYVSIDRNGSFDNITNIVAGERGTIVIQSDVTSGYTLTAYGTNWTFRDNLSSMSVINGGYNMINYYYSGSLIFAEMLNFYGN